MNTESKKIEDYLPLYLKCWGEVSDSVVEKYHDGKWVLSCGILEKALCGDLSFKPILRPLSDMTDEEAMSMRYTSKEAFLTMCTLCVGHGQENEEEMIVALSPNEYRHLLSKHFDLFGLIESGLAIDKTKPTQP